MQITIEGEDRSALYTSDELDGIEIEMLADQGQVGIGSAPVPTYDPTEEAYSGQQFLVESDGVTILDGFVGAMNRDRNGTLSGTRLTFHYGILDENALLGGHRAVNWVRPSETDRARILAANTEFLSHLSLDVSMVLNTNLETLPAKTYMTEDVFGELQTDCGDPTAKDLYIENRRLHWHRQTEGDAAGLTIVATGANRTTTFELDSSSPPQRSKDGMDLGVDVLARNGAGLSYTVTDATAQTRHDSAGMRHQRLIEQDGATLAQLTVLADRMLATYKNERITYEGTIGPLTSAQVALIRPGMVITATDAVWGLSGSSQRIAGVRLKYKHPDQWMATLSLGYAPRLRVKPIKETADSSIGTGRDTSGGTGECGDCPDEPWVCTPTDFYVPWVTGPGNTGGSCVIPAGSANVGGGCNSNGTGGLGGAANLRLYVGATYSVHYHAFHAASTPRMIAQFLVGATPIFGAEMGSVQDPGTWGPALVDSTADFVAPSVGAVGPGGHYDASAIFTGIAGFGTDSSGSIITGTARYVSGPDPRFVDLGACTDEPRTNQRVQQAIFTGDGTTTSFTTDYGYAYAPRSMTLLVDGIDWTLSELTETDPTTGAYSTRLPFPAGAEVEVLYRKAA